jgi:hypothetical protein
MWVRENHDSLEKSSRKEGSKMVMNTAHSQAIKVVLPRFATDCQSEPVVQGRFDFAQPVIDTRMLRNATLLAASERQKFFPHLTLSNMIAVQAAQELPEYCSELVPCVQISELETGSRRTGLQLVQKDPLEIEPLTNYIPGVTVKPKGDLVGENGQALKLHEQYETLLTQCVRKTLGGTIPDLSKYQNSASSPVLEAKGTLNYHAIICRDFAEIREIIEASYAPDAPVTFLNERQVDEALQSGDAAEAKVLRSAVLHFTASPEKIANGHRAVCAQIGEEIGVLEERDQLVLGPFQIAWAGGGGHGVTLYVSGRRGRYSLKFCSEGDAKGETEKATKGIEATLNRSIVRQLERARIKIPAVEINERVFFISISAMEQRFGRAATQGILIRLAADLEERDVPRDGSVCPKIELSPGIHLEAELASYEMLHFHVVRVDQNLFFVAKQKPRGAPSLDIELKVDEKTQQSVGCLHDGEGHKQLKQSLETFVFPRQET